MKNGNWRRSQRIKELEEAYDRKDIEEEDAVESPCRQQNEGRKFEGLNKVKVVGVRSRLKI